METALAILMVLGIFVGVPALIGFAIGGIYILRDRRVRKAERVKALKVAISKAVPEQPAEAQVGAVAKKPTKKRVKVASR